MTLKIWKNRSEWKLEFYDVDVDNIVGSGDLPGSWLEGGDHLPARLHPPHTGVYISHIFKWNTKYWIWKLYKLFKKKKRKYKGEAVEKRKKEEIFTVPGGKNIILKKGAGQKYPIFTIIHPCPDTDQPQQCLQPLWVPADQVSQGKCIPEI